MQKIAAAQNFRDTRGEKFDDWFEKAKEKNESGKYLNGEDN
ncbi:MAG TPA: hypothetical protein PK530_05510 [Anaerolineales bacterium]|nr:hypothetical protein [Anaerolineales bacterium]